LETSTVWRGRSILLCGIGFRAPQKQASGIASRFFYMGKTPPIIGGISNRKL